MNLIRAVASFDSSIRVSWFLALEKSLTAAELLVSGLRKRGIDWMATLCGHGLDPLFEAARKAGMRLIDARNEQTAAYIADAYGRLTRRPGVCAVSSGIAQVNALTGLANAWFDQGPMLLISGAADSTTAGMGHFQDLDQVSLARPVAKLSRSIDSAARTLQILNEALDMAGADPRGPAHLMFPMDVQRSEAGDGAGAPPPLKPLPVPADLNVQEVARALATAKAPLAIAGSSMFYEGAAPRCEPFVKIATFRWSLRFGTAARSTGPAVCSSARSARPAVDLPSSVKPTASCSQAPKSLPDRIPAAARCSKRRPCAALPQKLGCSCHRLLPAGNQRAGRMAGRVHTAAQRIPSRNPEARGRAEPSGHARAAYHQRHRKRAHGKSGSVDRRRQHRAVGAPVAVHRSLPRRLADVWKERRCRLGHRGSDGGPLGVSSASRDPVIWRRRVHVQCRRSGIRGAAELPLSPSSRTIRAGESPAPDT